MDQPTSYRTISRRGQGHDGCAVFKPRLGEVVTVRKVTGRVSNRGLGTVQIGTVTGEGYVENCNGGTVIIGKVAGDALVQQEPICGDLTGGTVDIKVVTGHSWVWNRGPGYVTIGELAGTSHFKNVSGDLTFLIDRIAREGRIVERWSRDGRLKGGGTGFVEKARRHSKITVDGGDVTIAEIRDKAGVHLDYGRVRLPADAAGRLSGWLGGEARPEVPDGLTGAVVEQGEPHQGSSSWRPVFRWLAE
ncbi:hypothetical protein GWI34_21035 [Actinomadura sp. DSM 109109]|nr:hypothetical protein [Actinomadura lepetitiana]